MLISSAVLPGRMARTDAGATLLAPHSEARRRPIPPISGNLMFSDVYLPFVDLVTKSRAEAGWLTGQRRRGRKDKTIYKDSYCTDIFPVAFHRSDSNNSGVTCWSEAEEG